MPSAESAPCNPHSFQSIRSTLPIHIVGAIVVWIGIIEYNNLYGTLEHYPDTNNCFAVRQYLESAFIFGVVLGVVGVIFQVAAMKKLLGGVRWTTVLRLCLLWGLLIGIICFGAARFTDVDSGVFGHCLIDPPYPTLTLVTTYLIVLVIPIPLLLIIAWLIMRFIWKAEARWQFYHSTNEPR